MPKHQRIYFHLFLITLLAHGVMIFSKMLMWDSYLVVNAVQTGSFDMMKDCYYVTGRRVTIYVLEFLASLPNYIITFKIISVFIIWGIASLVYKLLNYFNFFSSTDNFFIAALTIAAPFYGIWFEMIAITAPFSYLLFLLACVCYINYIKQTRVIDLWLIAALMLFAISFELQSFYIFVYVFLGVLFLKNYSHQISIFEQLVSFIKKNIVLFIFPVIIYVLWNRFFPIDPYFKQYNQIKFEGFATIKMLAYNFGFSFFKLFISLPLLFIKAMMGDRVGALMTIIIIGAGMIGLMSRFKIDHDKLTTPTATFKITVVIGQVIVAVLILLAALFPYCLVNKPASALNYDARNAILVSLPVAILLVSLSKFLRLGKPVLVLKIILVVFCICSTYNYFIWNYRFEKSKQLMTALKQLPLNTMHKTLVFDDQTKPIGNNYFTSYEYNYFMKQITGKEVYCCMNTRDKMTTDLKHTLDKIEPMKFHFYMTNYVYENDATNFIQILPSVQKPAYSFIFIQSVCHQSQTQLIHLQLK